MLQSVGGASDKTLGENPVTQPPRRGRVRNNPSPAIGSWHGHCLSVRRPPTEPTDDLDPPPQPPPEDAYDPPAGRRPGRRAGPARRRLRPEDDRARQARDPDRRATPRHDRPLTPNRNPSRIPSC